ncbi:uncharacterized protein LOC110978879 isoform X2 [Acanthaster planci]|uniref:Uncharacterized protein LOC110978879 isoform X2 n=1 Tax=Acanthaster planci TaxID=133434 RepID=A0A8B7Y9H7_ACAPL|nr:uncharacterized protein LOC110978879 isoform X2 [Acanthaster planci]
MKSRRKRYRPVTEYNIKTPHRDNKVISKLHTINKEIEKISGKKEKESHADPRIISLKKCVEELGGLDAYQSASKLGEAHHGNINSAKWVLQKLKELNIRKEKGTKLKLLDVGALDNHYRKQKKWIDCTAIDLNPQNGCIIKADFFTFQIVLPLACLENSRYLSHELFQEMLESLGCNLTASHSSQKLSFVMCQFTGEPSQRKAFPKTVVRNGIKRNNFSIVMTS